MLFYYRALEFFHLDRPLRLTEGSSSYELILLFEASHTSALPCMNSRPENRQLQQGDFLEVSCPYSVSGYRKRRITELSPSAMLRLQVFSTS
jgi:hypothetical protein